MKTLNDLLTIGTRACGAVCGITGVALAALMLSIGLWRTLFIVLMCLLGVFVGGVKDKRGFVKNAINRLFPAKD